MIKELQYKGYATQPSDYECPDGQLDMSLNIINEDNRLQPIMQPKSILQLPDGYKVIYIHKLNAKDHYIIADRQETNLYWVDTTTQSITQEQLTENSVLRGDDILQITAMGNTLIIRTQYGMRYILWRAATNKYQDLGYGLPDIRLNFGLQSTFQAYPGYKADNANNKTEPPSTFKKTYSLKEVPLPNFQESDAAIPPKAVAETQDPAFSEYTYTAENLSGIEGDAPVKTYTEQLTAWAMAAMNKFVAKYGAEQNRFIFPFFIRYAIELYDGSTVMHSYPVLLIPNSRGPVLALNGCINEGCRGFRLHKDGDDNIQVIFRGRVYGFSAKLKCYISRHDKHQLQAYKDIIRAVNIYVTPPQYSYNQSGKVYGWRNMEEQGAWDSYYTVAQLATRDVPKTAFRKNYFADEFRSYAAKAVLTNTGWQFLTNNDEYTLFHHYIPKSITATQDVSNEEKSLPAYIIDVAEKNEEEWRKEMLQCAEYHKIAAITLDDIIEAVNAIPDGEFEAEWDIHIKDGTLSSLRARTTLTDDYQTRDTIIPAHMFQYNGRLTLAGGKRRMHNPLPPTTAWARIAENYNAGTIPVIHPDKQGQDRITQTTWACKAYKRWQIAIRIKSDTNDNVMQSQQFNTDTMDATRNDAEFPMYIYYPDRHACEAHLYCSQPDDNDNCYYQIKLEEHPMLYGAHWLNSLWKPISRNTADTEVGMPSQTEAEVNIDNKTYTSEINNPFFFPVKQINTIGTGRIIALSTAAQALSQGQFGQFPLYAFTTDGVWAMEIDNGGGAFRAKQPITRDVVLNQNAILQLDNRVIYATQRGLMELAGATSKCISDSIYTQTPCNLLTLTGMQQLHASLGHDTDTCMPIKPLLSFLEKARMMYDYIHQRIILFCTNQTYAYVYSLKSGMWGMMYSNLASTVNAYPDALAMTKDYKLVTFADTDEEVCKALYVTRPLKLAAPDTLKTITAIIQRGLFQRGDVRTVLYGSRDLFTWHLVWSSKDHYLRRFRGTPYKYFRIAGVAALTPDKSIFGATIDMQVRHTNQIR